MRLASVFKGSFGRTSTTGTRCPIFSSLKSLNVQTCCSGFIVSESRISGFQSIVNSKFSLVSRETFGSLAVRHCHGRTTGRGLVLSVSCGRFGITAIQLIASDTRIVSLVAGRNFSIPPP